MFGEHDQIIVGVDANDRVQVLLVNAVIRSPLKFPLSGLWFEHPGDFYFPVRP